MHVGMFYYIYCLAFCHSPVYRIAVGPEVDGVQFYWTESTEGDGAKRSQLFSPLSAKVLFGPAGGRILTVGT